MTVDGFTLTGLAFPVAPANLSGFTIQGYQWVAVSGSTPITIPRVCIPGTDRSRVSVVGVDSSRPSIAGADRSRASVPGGVESC